MDLLFIKRTVFSFLFLCCFFFFRGGGGISWYLQVGQDKTRQDNLFNQGSPISCKAGILRGPGFNKPYIYTFTGFQGCQNVGRLLILPSFSRV